MKIECRIMIIAIAFLLTACGTIPVEKRKPLRQEINERSDETINSIVAKRPELQEKLDASVGYFVGRVSATKYPTLASSFS